MTIYTSRHKTWHMTNTQEKIDALFTPAVRERFWSKVKRGAENECWPWIGPKSFHGYGAFGLSPMNFRANRVAYMLVKGPVPADLHVLHDCDNRACCNPSHLKAGTVQENARQRNSRLRLAHSERNGGAKLSPDQVYVIRASKESCAALAKRYSVHPTTISGIKRRFLWSLLPERSNG